MKKLIVSISMMLILFSGFGQLPALTDDPVVIMATFTQRDPGPADSVFKNYSADSLLAYFMNVGVYPNPMIKNMRILTHVYGMDSYKTILIYEVDKFSNIEKADHKMWELIMNSFKNPADADLFWKRWVRLFDRHEDTIMRDWVTPK